MVDDDLGDQSPFFPITKRGPGGQEVYCDSLAGSDDDSTPRPHLTLEERMAARGWRWSGNQLRNYSAEESSSGQPCLGQRVPSAPTATTDSLACAEPEGPPPTLRSSPGASYRDAEEAADSEDSCSDMYANAGAGIEGVSSSDDDA